MMQHFSERIDPKKVTPIQRGQINTRTKKAIKAVFNELISFMHKFNLTKDFNEFIINYLPKNARTYDVVEPIHILGGKYLNYNQQIDVLNFKELNDFLETFIKGVDEFSKINESILLSMETNLTEGLIGELNEIFEIHRYDYRIQSDLLIYPNLTEEENMEVSQALSYEDEVAKNISKALKTCDDDPGSAIVKTAIAFEHLLSEKYNLPKKLTLGKYIDELKKKHLLNIENVLLKEQIVFTLEKLSGIRGNGKNSAHAGTIPIKKEEAKCLIVQLITISNYIRSI